MEADSSLLNGEIDVREREAGRKAEYWLCTASEGLAGTTTSVR